MSDTDKLANQIIKEVGMGAGPNRIKQLIAENEIAHIKSAGEITCAIHGGKYFFRDGCPKCSETPIASERNTHVLQMALSRLTEDQLNLKFAKLSGWKLNNGKWWHDDLGDGPPSLDYCAMIGRTDIELLLLSEHAPESDKASGVSSRACPECNGTQFHHSRCKSRLTHPISFPLPGAEEWTGATVAKIVAGSIDFVDEFEMIANAHNASLASLRQENKALRRQLESVPAIFRRNASAIPSVKHSGT
jgi:hypothetical protein